jgi:hypothetical protein
MSTKVRATFLLVVVGNIFHLSLLETVSIVVGYWISTDIDQWLTKRARTKAIDKIYDDEVGGWKPDPDDPTEETKDEFSRVRLPKTEQIVVVRVADLLWRIEQAKLEKRFF